MEANGTAQEELGDQTAVISCENQKRRMQKWNRPIFKRKFTFLLYRSNKMEGDLNIFLTFFHYVKGPRAGPGPLGPRAPGILPPLPPPLWTALLLSTRIGN
ncbi:unnamed protein product [Nesidiocoris tenuis]|uniref:Uncharacterized protein n=1 Tax=Nesidiocoris tenuis TaxID=355587 RepID=A0A6H5FWG2_9HEMI|nr:unnamed protein product [Nesidiocoris tenuis]